MCSDLAHEPRTYVWAVIRASHWHACAHPGKRECSQTITHARHFFLAATYDRIPSFGHAEDAADDAEDAVAGRLSRRWVAAALLHRQSRLEAPICSCRSPRRHWEQPLDSRSSRSKSIKSSKEELEAVEKAAATLLPMVPVLAVKLAALCSNESSAGQQ